MHVSVQVVLLVRTQPPDIPGESSARHTTIVEVQATPAIPLKLEVPIHPPKLLTFSADKTDPWVAPQAATGLLLQPMALMTSDDSFLLQTFCTVFYNDLVA